MAANVFEPDWDAERDEAPYRWRRARLGRQAGCEALGASVFELPPGAKTFRSQVGLDRASGKGGCVRARLFANAAGTPPLWESPFLVGSEAIADTGVINLAGPAMGQKHLVLQVDPAHDGRPAGTDPLDIRDHADWFDPMLELAWFDWTRGDWAAAQQGFEDVLILARHVRQESSAGAHIEQ